MSSRSHSHSPADCAEDSWFVHKFGGSSLSVSECFLHVSQLMLDSYQKLNPTKINESTSNSSNNPRPADSSSIHRVCVVVSAPGEVKSFSIPLQAIVNKWNNNNNNSIINNKLVSTDKVTNYLIHCTELSVQRDSKYKILLDDLYNRMKLLITNTFQLAYQNHVNNINNDNGNNNNNKEIQLKLLQNLNLQSYIDPLLTELNTDIEDLESILRSVWLSKLLDDHCWWFGYGEIWSARLLSGIINFQYFIQQQLIKLNDNTDNGNIINNNGNNPNESVLSVWCDAREVLFLRPPTTGLCESTPNISMIKNQFNKWSQSNSIRSRSAIVVFTGYLASAHDDRPTTLGRDGSDYSASIMAASLNTKFLTIWSDVDGIYSANPAKVPDAVLLNDLSFEEASELAYFGAKILHPKTISPLIQLEIPILLKNTFHLDAPGSWIRAEKFNYQQQDGKSMKLYNNSMNNNNNNINNNGNNEISTHSNHLDSDCTSPLAYGVKGITEFLNLSLLQVGGTGLIGIPSVAHRLFNILSNSNFSVFLITQAGSEHSICLAIPGNQGKAAHEKIRIEFQSELENGQISTITLIERVACLAIVGDGMRSRIGVAGKFFSAIGEAGINILAIAQGSSERNISVIVKHEDINQALRKVHLAFKKSTSTTIINNKNNNNNENTNNNNNNNKEMNGNGNNNNNDNNNAIVELKKKIHELEEIIKKIKK